jgi:transcriptional regulator with XRE-family HTH domain
MRKSDLKKAIWKIREYRRKKIVEEFRKLNCTQRNAAKFLGISEAHMSKYLSGNRNLTERKILEFAKLFNKPAWYFFNIPKDLSL